MPEPLVEFSNAIADAVERAGAFVIGVPDGGREGVSGTIVREGFAVTAEHTIRGRDEVAVLMPSGDKVKAAVAGRDPATDIALLKLPATPAHARMAQTSRVGDIVLLVGRRGSEGLAATYGIVSAMGGPWRTWHGAHVEHSLRLDLNPFVGFSGGPVVNSGGEVLGMATSGPRRSVLTIPAATLDRILDQLIQHGRVPQAWIGVGLQPVTFPPSALQALGIDHGFGLLVVTVAPGSPADQAGVLLGDVLVTLDGSSVRGVRSLQPVLENAKIGKSIPIQLVRGGHLVQTTVTVGERP